MELQSQQSTISILHAAGMLFAHPSKAFALVAEQWHGIQPVLLFIAYGFFVGLSGFDLSGELGMGVWGLLLPGIAGGMIAAFGIYVVAGLVWFADRRFGAQVNLDHLITAFALAAVPLTILYAMIFIVKISGYTFNSHTLMPEKLLYIGKGVVTLYAVVLMCIANITISKLTAVKSILAVVLPLAVIYAVGLILVNLLVSYNQ